MRLARQSVSISTGNALLCDPLVVGDDGTGGGQETARRFVYGKVMVTLRSTRMVSVTSLTLTLAY